jgi:membrane-associated protease RseP (regulator of RpoE activity)
VGARLAARERIQLEPAAREPAGPETAEAQSRSRSWFAVLLAGLRSVAGALIAGLRRLNPRAVLLAAIIVAVIVAGALAISALSGGSSSSGGGTEASLSAADRLFGVQLSTPPNHGVVIETVAPGGPAELAGLDPGDTLTAINSHPVTDANSVAAAIKGLHAGGQAVLGVSRGSALIQTLLTLGGP